MSDVFPDQPVFDEDPLLDVADAAAHAGILPSSWRAGVAKGLYPQPDDPDEGVPKQRRRPRWRRSTVSAGVGRRVGRGRRTDLVAARRDLEQQRAAELAEPAPAPAPDVQAWLRANHRALLAVADVLVDHREALLAAAGAGLRDELAAAIDRAGEEISSRPSRLLASAVTYAQFLLRPDGPVKVPAEVREVLGAHARLHAQFNALRG